ncbi:hypothetical protein MWU60_17770 [Yoonia sp. F2084L]|nr:hypothetical protein [Yoonia sp. F2084L]
MWAFLVRSRYRGFDEDARMVVDNNLVAAPLLRRMWWYLEENDMDLYYRVCDPMADKRIQLTDLTAEEFRKVLKLIETAYDDFKSGRDPDFVGKPEDKQHYAARLEAFDKYLEILHADPRYLDT